MGSESNGKRGERGGPRRPKGPMVAGGIEQAPSATTMGPDEAHAALVSVRRQNGGKNVCKESKSEVEHYR